LSNESLATALSDPDPAVRRNAASIVGDMLAGQRGKASDGKEIASSIPEPVASKMIAALTDADAKTRVATLVALSSLSPMTDSIAQSIVAAWPKFDDEFQRSAAVAAASRNPAAAIAAALDSPDAPALAPLVNALTQNIDAEAAGKLVVVLAGKPASLDGLKRGILDGLGKSMTDVPAMTPELSAALGKLLTGAASGQALPLAAKWDKSGALAEKMNQMVGSISGRLMDKTNSDDDRAAAARELVALGNWKGHNLVPAVAGALIAEGTSNGLRDQLVVALASTDDLKAANAIVLAYGLLDANGKTAAFDAVLKRADWANAFLDALQAKQIDVTTLGPANAYRLRAHPDKAVAHRATAVLDELSPQIKAKKDAIAKLLPVAGQKGDAEHGKQLFTTTCTVCHSFHGVGAEIGPGLTGMGAHGAEELLVAVVDPNAEVDPSFVQWNIETKNGQAYAGVIATENPASITLKSLAGIQQIKTADIKSRVNTGRSLMPEGFEGLGGEALRDIITYLQSVDGAHFRTLDLHNAFTASTSAGLYLSAAAKDQSFEFIKTGTVNVGGVPFSIVGPEKAAGGANIVVLKGGPDKAFSKTLPQKVEVKIGGFKANRLHFLGGVTGWGFNNNSDNSDVLQITVHTMQGQRETLTCKNGVEFADYIRQIDVPGSKYAEGLVKNHQLRWFTKPLSGTLDIDHITLESPDSHAAPTIVAITAELAEGNAPAMPPTKSALTMAGVGSFTITATVSVKPAAAAAKPNDDANFKPQFDDAVPQPPATRPANGPRVLLVGGGSSHDFVKYFGAADKATLAPSVGWVDFTQNANGVASILDRVDVLVWSANQPVSSATCKALLDFANSGGKGIVALHPGTWYAWKNFPEWNAQIVGGGTRGHDKLGPYTVKITDPNSPITKGVTPSFEITDELYNYTADAAGTPIEVLAEATSPNTGKTFPQVWIVKHPKARIVGITLGHDARAHDLPEFQALLKNAVNWAGSR
jgi:putative heme-binding domain-containing protein